MLKSLITAKAFLSLLSLVSPVRSMYLAFPSDRLETIPSKRVFYSSGYGPGGLAVVLVEVEQKNHIPKNPTAFANGAESDDDVLLEMPEKQSVFDYSKSLKMLKNLKSEIQQIQTKIKNGELKPSPYLVDLLHLRAKELLLIARQIKANRQEGK